MPDINLIVKSSVLSRVVIGPTLINENNSGDEKCAKRYPIAASVLFPVSRNFISSLFFDEEEPVNLLLLISSYFKSNKDLPLSKLATFSLLKQKQFRTLKFPCNKNQIANYVQDDSVQYISISYKLPFCSIECSKNFSVANYLPQEVDSWLQKAPSVGNYAIEFTQYRPTRTLSEEHHRVQKSPWRSARSAESYEEMDSGSGFVDNTPKLVFNQTVLILSIQIPEGQVFKKCVTKEGLVLDGEKITNLNDYKCVKTAVMGNQDSWIFWNDDLYCVEGLPMNQQEGYNQFYLTCTYKFNQMISTTKPLEILVFKNKHLPNHKFGFRLKYSNSTEFFTKIHIKLDILTKIAQVIDRPLSEITVDRYSHTEGASFFELWITVHSVEYSPCSKSRLTEIKNYFKRLASHNYNSELTEDDVSNIEPSHRLSKSLSMYGLESVSMLFVGPCQEAIANINAQGQMGGTSSPPSDSSGSPEMHNQSIFSSPIVFVVIIATVVLIVAIVLVRARSNDSCLRNRKAGNNVDTRNFNNVKTKNAPVVFAEEIVDLQSAHLNSFKVNHHHKQNGPITSQQHSPHEQHANLSVCSVCSAGHTPPPPPPPPAGQLMPSDEQISQLFAYQNSTGNSFTLPMNRNVSIDVSNHKYSTLNHNNCINNVKAAPNHLVNHNSQTSNYHQLKAVNSDSDDNQPVAKQQSKIGMLLSDAGSDSKHSQSGHYSSLGASQNVPNFTTHAPKTVSINCNPVIPNASNGPASFHSDSPRSSSSSSFRQLTALAEIQGQQLQQNFGNLLGSSNHANTLSPSSANSPSSDLNFNDHSSESPAPTWGNHSPNPPMHQQV